MAPGGNGLDRAAPWLLAASMAIVIGRTLVVMRTRPIWFDEFSTVLISSVHSWSAYFRNVPADAQPPMMHLLTRLSLLLPIPLNFSARLPSLFGLLLAMVCVYLFVARRRAKLAAVCAAAFLGFPKPTDYAFEARPYALMIGFSALFVLLYQRYLDARREGPRAVPWTVAAAAAAAILTHVLGILFVLVPVLLAEFRFWTQRRRVDWRLWVMLLAGCTPFLYDLLLSRRTGTVLTTGLTVASMAAANMPQATLREVVSGPVLYRHVFPFFCIAVITRLLPERHVAGKASPQGTRIAVDDWLLPIGLYLAAILSWVIGTLKHYYFARYAAPEHVAFAMIFGMALVSGFWQRRQVLFVGFTLLLLVESPLAFLRVVRRGDFREPARQRIIPDGLPLAVQDVYVASPVQAPAVWLYATDQERSHILMATDLVRSRATTDAVPEATLRLYGSNHLLPFPMQEYDAIRASRKEVLVFSKPAESNQWLPEALERDGYRKTVVGRYTGSELDRFSR